MVCVSAQTVEYAGNSCYIDSLLFAMFATPSTLEKSFLESQRSGGSSKLQQAIKNTFVGQIRNPKGRVSRDDMSNIRKLVISLSAEEGRSFLKEDQERQQQDAGEFFEFISECLGDDSSKFEIENLPPTGPSSPATTHTHPTPRCCIIGTTPTKQVPTHCLLSDLSCGVEALLVLVPTLRVQ